VAILSAEKLFREQACNGWDALVWMRRQHHVRIDRLKSCDLAFAFHKPLLFPLLSCRLECALCNAT
jgi:hypothetical protein